MRENFPSVLISDYSNVELDKNIDVEYTTQDQLQDKNLHDYNIVFVKDLSKMRLDFLRKFFANVFRSPGLILFFPSQWNANYALYPNTFLMNRTIGKRVIITDKGWLEDILKNTPSNINMSHEVEVSLPNDQRANVNGYNAIRKVAGNKTPAYEEIARNPGKVAVSVAYRIFMGPSLIIYPKLEGSDTALQKLIGRIIKESIPNELGMLGEEMAPKWVTEVFKDKQERARRVVEELGSINKIIRIGQGLLTQTGNNLEVTVGDALEHLGVAIEQRGQERQQKDLVLNFSTGEKLITEVKGLKGMADLDDVSVFITGNPSPQNDLCFIVNHYRQIDPKERVNESLYPPFSQAAIKAIKENLDEKRVKSIQLLTSMELAKMISDGVNETEVLSRIKESTKIRLGMGNSQALKEEKKK